MVEVSKFIHEARKGANLTQGELAAKMGTDTNSVHRWEAGKVMPSAQVLLSILRICELTIVKSNSSS